jgi:hypothetical protein
MTTTNPYLGLRASALETPRGELDLHVEDPTLPWGVLTEIGFDKGTATIVAFADGNASLYWSSGGGSIGGFRVPSVRDAAKACVEVAGELVGEMHSASAFPLPVDGEVIFYARTDAGVIAASAPEDDLAGGQHALSPLFYAAQAVITAYREIEASETGHN